MFIAWEIIKFILNVLAITTIVDIILMGPLFPHFEKRAKRSKFFVSPKKETVRTEAGSFFEFQEGGGCAGFSSAFVLRHLGENAKGDEVFKEVPFTYGNGVAFPKGITGFFKKRGIKMKACCGNLAALQNELTHGNPVIVVIRSFVGKSFLHFACVTGYDEENIYFADSIKDWVNVDEAGNLIKSEETSGAESASESSSTSEQKVYYNRVVPVAEFKKLWNTSMLKMPLYFNIYFAMSAPAESKELWDAYNSNLEKIEGLTLVRGEEEKIPEGVYHLVCEILVRHTDGSYLLMKRDPTKPLYPDMWEATAGGSALQGESPVEGAMRELREETGIVSKSLEKLDWSLGKTCIHCRFLCVTDCKKDSIIFQKGETCAYRWVSAEELLAIPDEELVGWQMKRFVK